MTNRQLAVPPRVIGTFLPSPAEVPSEFRESSNAWVLIVTAVLADGIELPTPRSTIDEIRARRHLSVCLGSTQPRHADLIAGTAYLLSLWYL